MKSKKKRNKRLTRKIVLGFLLLVAAGGGVGVVLWNAKGSLQASETPTMEGSVQRGDLELTVSASGTTVGTTDYQLCDFTYSSEELIVESVSAGAGDSVKKGDTLYTLTEDSVASVQAALASDMILYKAELEEAKITYEEAVNEAETEYKMNLSLGDTAAVDYQDTLKSYQEKVEEREEKLKEIQDIVKSYPGEITTAESELKKAKKQITKLQKQVTAQETKAEKAETEYETSKQAYESAGTAYSEIETVAKYLSGYQEKEEENALTDLKNTVNSELGDKNTALQKAKTAYEQKKEVYEELKAALEGVTAKLQTKKEKKETLEEEISEKNVTLAEAKENVDLYRAQYLEAVSEQTMGKVTAEQTYKENMNTYENAESIYKTALKAAEEELQTAKDNLSEIKTQKKILASMLQGRAIQADRAGMLDSISYQSGDVLNQNMPLAGYQDSSVMNIEVAVDQEDITAIKVGDTLNVNLSSVRGGLEGTVSMIETTTSSERVSNVTYTVTVTVDNSSGNVSADETATVSFTKDTLEDVLYVPVTAVKTEASKSTIAVKTTAGTTREIEVSVGESNGQYIVLESGLKEGDIYVVEMDS